MKFTNSNILILILGYILIYLFIFDPKISLIGDNATYFLLGKAVSEGQGFINLNNPLKSSHHFYPPGYPFFIALLLKIYSDSFAIVKIGNGLLLLASLIIVYRLFEKFTSKKMAFITTLILMFNSHMLLYSTIMMSEMLFFFLSLTAIYLFLKINWSQPKIWLFLIMTLVALSSYFVRSAGIILVIWILISLLTRKEWKYAGSFLSICGIVMFTWQFSKSSSGYINQALMVNPYQPELGLIDFSDFFERTLINLGRYISYELPNVLFPIINIDYGREPSIINWVIGLSISLILIIGFTKQRKFILYVILMGALILSWPQVWVGVRFILPLLPFLLLAFLIGVEFIIKKALKIEKISPAWWMVIILIQIMPLWELHKQSKSDYSKSTENYLGLATWLTTQSSGRVICSKPDLFYLFSGNYSYRYPYSGNPEVVLEYFKSNQIKYVVLDKFFRNSQRYLYPVIKTHPEHFREIKRLPLPETILYKFNPK